MLNREEAMSMYFSGTSWLNGGQQRVCYFSLMLEGYPRERVLLKCFGVFHF